MIDFTNRFERLTYMLTALSKGESLSTPTLVIISKYFKSYELLGITNNMIINLSARHQEYLKFHREEIFKK